MLTFSSFFVLIFHLKIIQIKLFIQWNTCKPRTRCICYKMKIFVAQRDFCKHLTKINSTNADCCQKKIYKFKSSFHATNEKFIRNLSANINVKCYSLALWKWMRVRELIDHVEDIIFSCRKKTFHLLTVCCHQMTLFVSLI